MRNTLNPFRNTLTTRFLSSIIRVKVPEHITDEFNEFHIKNHKNIKPFPSYELVKKISSDLVRSLQVEANKGDNESKLMIEAISEHKKNPEMGIFLKDGPGEGEASNYFERAICCILGYKTREPKHIQENESERMFLDSSDISEVFPHIDIFDERSEKIDIVTLVGYLAQDSKFRTSIIPLKDVLNELDEKTISILCEPIFFRKQDNNPEPILKRKEDGSIIPKFVSTNDKNHYGINLPENSQITEIEAKKAVQKLNNLLIDFFKNRELESVFIKTGYNEKGHKIVDTFIIPNLTAFHSANNTQEYEYPRIIFANNYTKDKMPLDIKPSNVVTNRQTDKIKTEFDRSH